MKSKGLIDSISKLVVFLLIIEAGAVYLNMEKNSLASMEINDLSVKTATEEVLPPGDAILFGKVSSRNYRICLNRDYVSSEFDAEPTLNSLDAQAQEGKKTILMALKERAEDIKHGAIVHVVKSGENVDRIAELYGITAKSLCLRNDLPAGAQLKAGQILRVVPRTEFRYTVRPGDTLWSISNQYSIDSMDIIKANEMTSAMLRVGQDLVIPWQKRDREWRRKYLMPEADTEIRSQSAPVVVAQREEAREAAASAPAATPVVAAASKPAEQTVQKASEVASEKTSARMVAQNSPSVATPSRTADTSSVSKKRTPRKKLILSPLGKKCTVVSAYGMRNHPVYKRKIFHAGVDIRAKTGTKLHAAADGKVDFAGWIRGYGKIVIIKHAKGYSTRYAHMSDFDVRKGQNVKAGQFIGKSGMTGTVTGPHLHFEVRRYGRTLNPAKYL